MLRLGAFFDLDRTLFAGNTGRLFLKDLRAQGQISLGKALRMVTWLAKYHLSIVDLQAVARQVAGFMRGRSEQEFAEQCQRMVEDQVLPQLLPEGLRTIESHRQRGHMVALLSTSPSYIVQPLARTLKLDAAGGTQFEVKGGQFTGELVGPACFGAGKVHWAEQMGRTHGVDVDGSWFYTDSFTDMPMLQRVANRIVVNPDPRLKREARTRGWQMQDWISGRP